MKIYLATWLGGTQGVSLTRRGARTRLVSYFHIKDKSSEEVVKYIKSGTSEEVVKYIKSGK